MGFFALIFGKKNEGAVGEDSNVPKKRDIVETGRSLEDFAYLKITASFENLNLLVGFIQRGNDERAKQCVTDVINNLVDARTRLQDLINRNIKGDKYRNVKNMVQGIINYLTSIKDNINISVLQTDRIQRYLQRLKDILDNKD